MELEGIGLWWPRKSEEIANIAIAWGPFFGLAEGDLENWGDMADPVLQSGGGELKACLEWNIMVHRSAIVVEDKVRQAVDVACTG
jgi:hypothetical protein